MPKILLSPEARRDLFEVWEFIARDNIDAADRVTDAAFRAFDSIAENPEMGRARQFKDAALGGVRSLLIPEFRNYLIFYRPVPKGIEVIRVLQGSRDLDMIFGESGAPN